MIARVLAKTGATVRARDVMYKVMAQSVILYGSGSCVVKGKIIKVLEGFHHREIRRITGMTATCGAGREWEYLLVVVTLEAAGLQPIIDYIRRQYTTIAENLACCPIYELYVEAEWILGTIRMIIWWYQGVVNEPE